MMRYTQRRRLLTKAHNQAERVIASTAAPLLDARFKWLKRDLRRANLRKRLTKSQRDTGVLYKVEDDWNEWIALFTQALMNVLPDSVDELVSVETRFWQSRQQRPDPVEAAQVLTDYEARVGRQITNIAVTTRDNTLATITDWYNTDAGLPELIDSLEQWYSRERAELIGRTEATYLTSSASATLYQQMHVQFFNVDLADETDEWPCDACIAQADRNPHVLTDAMPAYHPRCRCGTVPATADGNELIYGAD